MSEIARYINTNQLSYQTSVIYELNLLFRFTNTEQNPVLAHSLFNFDDFSTLEIFLWFYNLTVLFNFSVCLFVF